MIVSIRIHGLRLLQLTLFLFMTIFTGSCSKQNKKSRNNIMNSNHCPCSSPCSEVKKKHTKTTTTTNKQTNKQKAVNNKSRKKHLTFYFIFEKKQDLPDNCKLALPSPGKNLFHIKQNHFVLMHQCSANCSQTLIDLHLGFNILPYCLADLNFEKCLFVGWLLNVQATCQCISGTDLLRQVYMLPH